jgi:hypothetical protein
MSQDSLIGVDAKQNDPGGISEKTEHSILSKLLYDEREFLGRLEETIERAMQFFRLEPRTGRVVLTDEAKRRKVQDQIRLLLAGRYFAWKLKIVGTDKMNYREIGVELNRPPNGISPELTELVRTGDLIRDEEGLVSMPFHRIDGILREVEQAVPYVATEGADTSLPHVKRNGSRRGARQGIDPVVQSMLEKTVDLSEFVWVKYFNRALERGLAALYIAKEKYEVSELNCAQIEMFITRAFPVRVTRAAVSMALMQVKSEYVAAISRGNEIYYSLLPLGRDYLMQAAEEFSKRQKEFQNGSGGTGVSGKS